jgi:hypothetical protein|nr:MAG TPA: hypothetical protein [Caudoviricetes sp.]
MSIRNNTVGTTEITPVEMEVTKSMKQESRDFSRATFNKTYPELPETNFPDSLDVFERFSDVTSGDIVLVNQYQTYMLAGNQAAAAKLIADNPDLKNKIINASTINKFLDAVSALERMFKDDIQKYIASQAGTAGQAAKLSTAKLIDGIGFDGTQNVTRHCLCETIAGASGKIAVPVIEGSISELTHGLMVTVRFKNGNTAANPTLKIEIKTSTGTSYTTAKSIYYNGVAMTNNFLANANSIYSFVYDSTLDGWLIIGYSSKHTATTAALTSAGWNDNVQVVSVSGVTADNFIFVGPAVGSEDVWAKAGVRCFSQSSGQLTFTCKKTPETNLTANIFIVDVKA